MEINKVNCYLSLGSNIGDRILNLENAIKLLNDNDVIVSKQSSFYESEPWGYESSNAFINCCVSISTKLCPEDLLNKLKSIEQLLGRSIKSIERDYSDRIIDIDLLFYGDLILKTENLIVPHLHFSERNFVLIPLAEISPNLISPVDKLTITQHIINSRDNNQINQVKK